MKQHHILYRLANQVEVNLLSGEFVNEELASGFVFYDFESQNQNILKIASHSIVTSPEDLPHEFFKTGIISAEKSTTEDEYDFGFTIIQNEITHKKIQKAILSRKIVKNEEVDVVALFFKLAKAYPTANVFLITAPDGNLWIGATPETLLDEESAAFKTMSLAGTKNDLATAWTQKEFEEQHIVTNAIAAELFKLNIDPQISEQQTIKAGPVYHLKNEFTFQSDQSVLKIAKALHPTPAISGFPQKQAYTTIGIAENHQREYYCGIGGPLNINGKTNLFVNLRCAKITQNQIILYAGGGITANSNLNKEWEECSRKAEAILTLC